MYFVSFICHTGHGSLSVAFETEEAAKKVFDESLWIREQCAGDNMHAVFCFIDGHGMRHHLNLVNYRVSMGSFEQSQKQHLDSQEADDAAARKVGKGTAGFIR